MKRHDEWNAIQGADRNNKNQQGSSSRIETHLRDSSEYFFCTLPKVNKIGRKIHKHFPVIFFLKIMVATSCQVRSARCTPAIAASFWSSAEATRCPYAVGLEAQVPWVGALFTTNLSIGKGVVCIPEKILGKTWDKNGSYIIYHYISLYIITYQNIIIHHNHIISGTKNTLGFQDFHGYLVARTLLQGSDLTDEELLQEIKNVTRTCGEGDLTISHITHVWFDENRWIMVNIHIWWRYHTWTAWVWI